MSMTKRLLALLLAVAMTAGTMTVAFGSRTGVIAAKETLAAATGDIDFQKEALNVVATGTSSVGFQVTTAPGVSSVYTPVNDQITIPEDWMGKTVNVTEKFQDGSLDNANAKDVPIPARPAAPITPTAVDATKAGNGKITGVTTAMEWQGSASPTWTDCIGNEITGLNADTYLVRTKATGTAFASSNKALAIALHVHTTECLVARINVYNQNGDGQMDNLSLDTAEANPKSDYFTLNIDCQVGKSVDPAIKPAITIVDKKYSDMLSVSEPAISYANVSGSQYAARFILKEDQKEKILGSHEIALNVSFGEFKWDNLKVKLYAEPKDPMYIKGMAEFTVDLDDIQSEYTSTEVELLIPGGVRSVGKLEVMAYGDEISKDMTAKTTDKGFALVVNAVTNGETQQISLPGSSVQVRVTFKARTAPIVVRVPVEVKLANTDALTLDYAKELVIPDKATTEITAVVAENYNKMLEAQSLNLANYQQLEGGRFEINYSDPLIITATQPGYMTFDVRVFTRIVATSKDEKTVLSGYTYILLPDNKITAKGVGTTKASARLSWVSDNTSIDLNNLDSYRKEFLTYCTGVDKDGKALTVQKVELLADLNTEYNNSVQGIAADYFDFAVGAANDKHRLPVTLTLKNVANTMDQYAIRPQVKITLSDGQEFTDDIYLVLNANAPTVKAYTYGTDKVIVSDKLAVGESKKYDIKTTGTKPAKVQLYVDSTFMTIVRGREFYDFTEDTTTETVTVRVDKAPGEDDYCYLNANVYYAPQITNDQVLIQVSGTEWNLNSNLIDFVGDGTTDPGEGTKPVISGTVKNGKVGTAYSQQLTAAGTTPITWSVTSGALPKGLTLSKGGLISGTPTQVETAKFTVTATNAAGSANKAYTILIVGKDAVIPDPEDPDDNDNNGGNGGGSSGGGNGPSTAPAPGNNVNSPETLDKLTETVDAIKDLGGLNLADAAAKGKLPAGVTVEKTASGASIAVIPVKMTENSAITLDTMLALGKTGSNVGILASIGNDATILLPGGFGNLVEPGRLSFPMTYKKDAPDQADMLAKVKGENAKSDTVQLGAHIKLPATATLTIKTTIPEGETVKIYCLNPVTGKLESVGTAKVVNGKVAFGTKQLGQFLFTTGTV